jgi:hypothetical protein
MTCGAVDLAPLLRVVRMSERPLLFLLRGLLATICAVSLVLVITSVSCVDLTIILLP